MKYLVNLISNDVLTRPTAILATVLLCVAGTASAAETAYTMTTFIDSHYGAEVVAGRYEHAIQKIVALDEDENAFFRNTNLCVAYTKTGALDKALMACDAAVEQAGSMPIGRKSYGYRYFQKNTRDELVALALANRGVLYAVSGEADLARRDFVEALNSTENSKAVKVNLARLGEVDTKKV